MKKNVILLRVSSNKQEFISQKESLDNYIKNNKIVIHEVIEEFDVSGFKTPLEQREGLMKIRDMAVKGEIENLYVYSSDRIGRRMELISFISVLTENNVRIISVTEGVLNNKDNDVDELLNCIRFYTNQTESKKTSDRVKNAKMAKAKEGSYQSSVTPYGYNRTGEGLEVNKEEAEIVRLAFNLYMNYGSSRTCDELINRGYTKRGTKWTHNTLKLLFKNKLYIGEYWYKGELVYKNDKFRILDDITFYNAINTRKQRATERGTETKGANKSTALLEGLLFKKCLDGQIRKLMVDYSNYNNKDGTRYAIYRSAWDKVQKTSDKKTYSANKYETIIENKFMEIVDEMLDVQKLEEHELKNKNDNLKSYDNKIQEKQKTLEQKEKALKNAEEQLEKIFTGESSISLEMIDNLIKKLKVDIKDINIEIKELEEEYEQIKIAESNKEILIKQFKTVKNIYDKATYEQRKLVLNKFINQIIIHGEKDIEIKLNI